MTIDSLEPIASLEEMGLAASLHPIERLQIARRAFPASPARISSLGCLSGSSCLFRLSCLSHQIDQINQTDRPRPGPLRLTFHLSRLTSLEKRDDFPIGKGYSARLKVASNPGLLADISDGTLSDAYDLWMNV